MNLTDAIKTVRTHKVPRVIKTEVKEDSLESQVSLLKQSDSDIIGRQQNLTPRTTFSHFPASAPATPEDNDECPPLSRASSGHDKYRRSRHTTSPQPADMMVNPVYLDSGIASIEDTSLTRSSSDMLSVLTRCNGKLQRAMRIEESEATNCRDSVDARSDETEPLVSSGHVAGVQPTQNRCHVQTSGWL